MDNILMMDFELNKPLTYLSKFKEMLNNDGWNLDMFWAKDYSSDNKPTLDDKINSANLLLIRKPLTFLSSQLAIGKIQEAVLKEKKNLLLMMTYIDLETNSLLRNFLKPFNIIPSGIKAIDTKTNQDNKRMVIYHKKNKCFLHDELFKNVNKILIPDAINLFVDSPAKILIRGNPSTEAVNTLGIDESEPTGSDIIVGAYHEEKGRLITINSTLFLDNYFDFNKPFIKNIMTWLRTDKKQKKKQ